MVRPAVVRSLGQAWPQAIAVGDAFTLLTTEPGPDVAPIDNRQVAVLERSD